jgi:hypothetical protein
MALRKARAAVCGAAYMQANMKVPFFSTLPQPASCLNKQAAVGCPANYN